LGVSRSGYWAWQQRQRQPLGVVQQAKQQAESCLRLQIRAAHRKGRCYYSSPRVQDELRDQGIYVSRKRVARLMREEGLVGRSRARRRVQTTDSRHSYRVADNLLERRFTPQEVACPNRFWCGDITYLPTAHGWIYLATVKDLFSRRIVGWAVDDSLEATLVATAWHRALKTRGFTDYQGPLLYHSDRGSQYCGELFEKLLKRSGTQPSMSGKGECLDNAVAESFFGTLKAELLADQPERRFASKTQAALLVGDYIDNFYNSIRKHSALGNKCPIAFELAYQVNTQ
jgi:transposase InsO family protein